MAERWLVTGMGRGIGLGVAAHLLQRGDRVVGSIRTDSAAADDLKARFGAALELVRFDLRSDNEVERAAAGIAGPLDVLFNNAAAYGPRNPSAVRADRQGLLETFEVNAVGTLRVIEAFLPKLAAAARPRIVAVSSTMGAMADQGPGDLAYRVSKAALNKLMQGIGAELQPRGIAVACLRPGWVRTDMGGPGAPLEIGDSAADLVAVVDGLRPAERVAYLDRDGRSLAW
jgi:NAD(P)-dependent dehydrogenase (short-subunit alcohol dehydrogenase family)